MADSRVGYLSSQMGKKLTDAGSAMYHAADGVTGGGEYGKEKRHRIRKALARLRLRATGMTDDIRGSKETQGQLENPYETSPRE